MKLTRGADYALRIMIYMAGLPEGQRVGRAAIAVVTEVPEAYLAKILQHLVKARLIRSRPGVRGGFEMSRSPLTLSMLEVIEAVDGPAAMTACLADENSCDRSPYCSVRHVLQEAQHEMLRVLRATTVARLAQQPFDTGHDISTAPQHQVLTSIAVAAH